LVLSHIRLESQLDPGLPPVMGDFNQLQQCLINLIFNAVDAMPGGGTLTLSAAADLQKPAIVITVKDTGPGIPPEHLEDIFEPFFTTKSEGHGLGLGLSTVYGIVERHQGTVASRNSDEGGAVFVITLPIAPKT
jgi:signal transduction histidine kinase